MAIAQTGRLEEEIGGARRPLLLRNGEIERFEIQYAPFGIFELFDQLFGRGPAPQVRHVRDIVALGLVGGGMPDAAADRLIAGLPPSENLALRLVAQRLLGVTFMPAALDPGAKKKPAGSGGARARRPRPSGATTPGRGSETSSG